MAVQRAADPDLPDGYRWQPGAPDRDDYRRLRAESGLTPVSIDQAEGAITGGWRAVHVVHEPSGDTVAMGRVIGDGGWYFHIVDMAVLPEHQRRGIGAAVLGALLDTIHREAPADAFVSLMADPPGVGLYQRFGFAETAPKMLGMAQWVRP